MTNSTPATKTILTNAFSLNMIDLELITSIRFVPIRVYHAAQWISNSIRTGGFINAIGHADTDNMVKTLLTNAHWPSTMPDIPAGVRASIKMDETTTLIVAQYSGPRLPEGATTLPEGAKIEFIMAQILPHQAVNLLRAAENAYGEDIKLVDGDETDVGGWLIVGNYELPDGSVVGGWGPTYWETSIRFPNGMKFMGH